MCADKGVDPDLKPEWIVRKTPEISRKIKIRTR